MPNFILGVDFIVFPAFIFANFKPLPHPPHKGSAVFLNIGLTQTCIAIAPLPSHMGTLPKHQEDDKEM